MGEWDNAEAESFDSWFQDDQVQGAQSLWQDLTAGYVLGNLSPDEAIAVQAYLAEHPDAVAELAQLQETLHVLPLALPETAEPPLALRDLVLQDAAAFGQESPVMLKQPRATRPLRQRSWVPWLGFSVAAGLAIAGGLTTRQLHQELRLAEQRLTQSESQAHQMRSHLAQLQSQLDPRLDTLALLQRANNRLLPLNGSGGLTATSSGSLVIAPQVQTAILTLQKLPAPPAGKAYQLWAMIDGQKIYCMEFKPDAQGRVFIQIPIRNWANAPSVSITLEDTGTIPNATGEMVLSSPLI